MRLSMSLFFLCGDTSHPQPTVFQCLQILVRGWIIFKKPKLILVLTNGPFQALLPRTLKSRITPPSSSTAQHKYNPYT